jgi:hypothetical protein
MADVADSGPTQALDVPDFDTPAGEDEPQKPQPWGRLVSLNTKFPNIDLVEETILFGRGSNCQVVYQDRSVSTTHAKIFRERIGSNKNDCVVWVEDLRYIFAWFYNLSWSMKTVFGNFVAAVFPDAIFSLCRIF